MSDTPAPDPEALSDFEQQIVEVFESRGGEGPPDDPSSPGPGAPAPKDASSRPGDGATETPPASSPSTDAGGAPDLDFVEPPPGGTPDATTPPAAPAADTATPPTPDASPDAADTPPVASDAGAAGVDDDDQLTPPSWDAFSAEQQASAQTLLAWQASLSPDQTNQINAVLSGEYTLVPTAQMQVLQERWNQTVAQPPPPASTAESAAPPVVPEGYEDDPVYAAMSERMAQLEAAQMQQQVAQQTAQSTGAIESSFAAWHANHPELTEADVGVLEDQLINSGIYGPLAAQYGDEYAVNAGLDQMLYSNQVLRAKAIQSSVDAQLQQTQAQIAQQQANGQRASAVAGSAPAPPAPGQAPVGMTTDEAMEWEIEQALKNGQ